MKNTSNITFAKTFNIAYLLGKKSLLCLFINNKNRNRRQYQRFKIWYACVHSKISEKKLNMFHKSLKNNMKTGKQHKVIR